MKCPYTSINFTKKIYAILILINDFCFSGDKKSLTLRHRGERVSLTFRKSLPNNDSKCTCTFVDHCPSQKSVSKLEEMDESTAIQLEKMHVHTGVQI